MGTVMITGPSTGIGKATAQEMARRGYHVVAAGRSEERTLPVVEEIDSSGGSAEYLHLDLASLDSCRRAAESFVGSGRPLDILVANAGVGGAIGRTEDGFEIHFGVNHLGHFMLTHHLTSAFRHGTRIVVVSSEAHRRAGGIDFERVTRRGRLLTSLSDYAVSKLANILFTRRLARLHPEWNTYAVHPGLADTNIFPPIAKLFFRNRKPPEEAAATTVYCATSEEVASHSGFYYSRMAVRDPSSSARDGGLARELWEHSEQWCGVGDHNESH